MNPFQEIYWLQDITKILTGVNNPKMGVAKISEYISMTEQKNLRPNLITTTVSLSWTSLIFWNIVYNELVGENICTRDKRGIVKGDKLWQFSPVLRYLFHNYKRVQFSFVFCSWLLFKKFFSIKNDRWRVQILIFENRLNA